MSNNMMLLDESTMNRSYGDNRNRPVGARQRQIYPEKNRPTTERNNSKNSLYRQTIFNLNQVGQFMLAGVGQF